jgi:membrane-associated protease RseP (regulator of RpoE activity)
MTDEDVSAILSTTHPGDRISLTVEHQGEVHTYELILAAQPDIQPQRSPGFMGIYYYQGDVYLAQIKSYLNSPRGIFYFLIIPFTSIQDNFAPDRMLVIDTVEASYYTVPFPFYWGLVHLIFWTGWINLLVGTFNAIPMVPLDGGYIMREGIGSFLKKRGWEKYTENVILTISWIMLFIIVAVIVIPWLFKLATGA